MSNASGGFSLCDGGVGCYSDEAGKRKNASFFFKFLVSDYRAASFFLACAVYSLFSSPTPDNFGSAEVAVLVLFSLSIGIDPLRKALIIDLSRSAYFWKSAGQAFLLYGVCVPLIGGALAGNGLGAILRDIVPFLCLFLPVFFFPLLKSRPEAFLRAVLWGSVLIGIVFSVRSVITHMDISCSFSPLCSGDKLLYLENMPTVLFSSLFLIGTALTLLISRGCFSSILVSTGAFLLAALPALAMFLTLQRAGIGAIVLYAVIISAFYFFKAPVKTGVLLILFLSIGLYVSGIPHDAFFSSMIEKNRAVGLNMRLQEFSAVWDVVTRDPVTFLFGIGWGGHFNSPAVGGLSVNFTHNFFSSMLLKGGLVGTLLCSAYILGLLERLLRVIVKYPVLGFALAAPVFIDLVLYASFKSLDFGLVLLMIPACLLYSNRFESHEGGS